MNPEGPAKTLIFSVNRNHADKIVEYLKQAYIEQGIYDINDDMIVRMTGEIKDIDNLIKKFKNEIYPTIVVTVDLLTMGIDVPRISNLVFLRKVNSRILYHQMLGRATRKCNEIVQKLWNLCNVLRDDGITYHEYVTELTYILFLKMAKEKEQEKEIPEEYSWDNLILLDGLELKSTYQRALIDLSQSATSLSTIYKNAKTNIEEPSNLRKIFYEIDKIDWYSVDKEDLGDLYEGLLEKMPQKRNLV
nr:type I restriction-modification system subunit M N-terminal domain-containing protein [Pseudostreptobacillus hongkongensis]